MKKLIFVLILIIGGFPLLGQDFSGIKICVNPGHGGHDSDDRYIPLTGYWESEGNLTKGLYLRDILEGWGADIVMTRTTNTTEDDLPLSQICEIANTNNVDFFHSIHSNASQAQVNHPLMLFRGYTDDPVFPAAKEMGSIMWQELISGHKWCVWNYDYENNIGDWSFRPEWGTQGYGVLRTLEMPGVLSEGSHHDHPMESWRLQNLAYRKHEAWIFAKSYIRFFETASFNLGEVVGIARDAHKEPEYSYLEGSGDNRRPIDQMTFHLLPGNKVFQGDSMNNGFFMFDSLQPGNYQVVYEHEDYFNDTADVTIEANSTTFADVHLQYDTTKTPLIKDFSPAEEVDSVHSMEPVILRFSEPMDSASVVQAFSAQPEVTGTITWENNHKLMTFTPGIPYQKATDYTVTLAGTAKQKWGVPLGEDFTLEFTSQYRNRYHLVAHYPNNDQQNVNPAMAFSLHFDAPINQGSLLDNVTLLTSAGDTLRYKSPKIYEIDGMGVFRFTPAEQLNANTAYKLHLNGKLSDENGNILYHDSTITFSTIEMPDPIGDVLFAYEGDYSWEDPDDNAETTGTDPNRTYFVYSTTVVREGETSGRLDYAFEADEAEVVLLSPEKKEVVNGMDLIDLWVHGDMSFNHFKIRLVNDAGETESLSLDTINWSGWKLCNIAQNEVSLDGKVYLDALVIKRLPEGLSRGTLHFDDFMTAMELTGIISQAQDERLRVYPNPAANHLSFSFENARRRNLVLKIYHTTGRKVHEKTIETSAGMFQWSIPSHLSNGMYVYAITAKNQRNNPVHYRGTFVLHR